MCHERSTTALSRRPEPAKEATASNRPSSDTSKSSTLLQLRQRNASAAFTLCFLLALFGASAGNQGTAEAEFAKAIPNLSVVRGKEAFMKCSVRNLGVHKVSWTHVDSTSLLTINDHVITSNSRIKVHQEEGTWTLVINNVALEDRGYYSCQISGTPQKSQVGFLDVVVPPFFEDASLKGDTNITVNEYANVTLSCRADGNPKPSIKWRREDGQPIRVQATATSQGDSSVIFSYELKMLEVTRWSTGAYMCIANSGVSPSISRRIMLVVQFPPMIRIPSQIITVGYGQNVTLECITESFPLAQHEWLDPFDNKITPGEAARKYRHHVQKTYHFKVIYRLSILQVDYGDTGSYVCQVRNSLGVTRSGLSLQVVDRSAPLTSTGRPPPTRTEPLMPPTESVVVRHSVMLREDLNNDTDLDWTPRKPTATSSLSPKRRGQKDKDQSFVPSQSVWQKAKAAVTSDGGLEAMPWTGLTLGLFEWLLVVRLVHLCERL